MSFLVYMTVPTQEEARSIGKELVSSRLAACINIFPAVESIYRWENEVQSSHEVVLIAKTSEEKVTALTQRARELHSYDVPCILSLAITGGSPEFLSWIENETR
ncbi:divalent-cation tolerance protein CutA [Halodesulfovibrio sp.]|jgi:periplasmic divalent cation tolerance protein|uniref:divalent-cation tolerance protein CutA n=1 Tax=Halodesulfovibrio sp. TaxID=1912772 RepID=UPI0025F9B088|nr:divalent-cation tolerance protein CutA [Halodesulfovibrio sp.]MCT4536082.1 divalent-cation tolerance protein CutA [Halodesulfovibrio sp.]MCT4626725.1 divalent-cation tolerance protein CutA [Halodesulfovibrio sp.]